MWSAFVCLVKYTINNVTENDSKEYVGNRMADMFAGVISKLMQALKIMLTNDYKDDEIKKTLHNKLTIEPIADNEEE